MSKIKWVFLDFDGTLVNSLDIMFRIYEEFMKEEDLPSSKNEFDTLNGPSLKEIVTIIKSKYGLNSSINNLYTRYQNKVEQLYPQSLPFDFSLKLLKILHDSYKLGLVTSMNLSIVVEFLNRNGWKNFFSVIVSGDDVVRSKPHPDIYQKCLQRANIDKDSVVAIEDSINGIKSATDAGIKSIHIDHEKLKLSDVPGLLHSYEKQ